MPKKKSTYVLAALGAGVLWFVFWIVTALPILNDTFDEFEAEVRAIMPTLPPDPSILGREVAISDTVAIDYIEGTSYKDSPSEKFVKFALGLKSVREEGARFLIRTHDKGKFKRWSVKMPGCSGEQCAEIARIVKFTPITAQEWDVYQLGSLETVEIYSRVIDGMNHWAYLNIALDENGDAKRYVIYLKREPRSGLERFLAEASSGNATASILRIIERDHYIFD